MIFNEIYSVYYNTVAKIVSSVLDGNTDKKSLEDIVAKNAFGESVLSVLPAVRSEKWQIIKSDMTTPLMHKPTMPLTTVQKQWLKAISLDPRISLFDFEIEGLDDVEPLFLPEDYYVYDKYADGDPYDNEIYISNFKTALSAIRKRKKLRVVMRNRKGETVCFIISPKRIEYSEKDDKFRIIGGDENHRSTVNITRIISCRIHRGGAVERNETLRESVEKTVVLKVSEERNTLERCMLHFAHFEKRAEKLPGGRYLLHIKYSTDDEPEMVIRILSFGPLLEVTEPQSFRNLIAEKLKKQRNIMKNL